MGTMISKNELNEIETLLINNRNKQPHRLLIVTIVTGLFSYYIINTINQYL